MPRGKKRTTQSGDDAQNIGSVPGQRYGEGVAQQQMQEAMPAPDRGGVPSAGTAPAPAPPAGNPTDPASIAQLLGQAPLGLLSGGTQMPNQPITAGLSSGPGGGPEMLGPMQARTPLSRTLDVLYQRTGERMFRDIAERAGL